MSGELGKDCFEVLFKLIFVIIVIRELENGAFVQDGQFRNCQSWSFITIHNNTWSILIQQIRIIWAGDNLTGKTQKKDPFTSLHKIKENLSLWAELEILRNGALY